MKYLIVFALLISFSSCSSKKLTTKGLKSNMEEKTGVIFKDGKKSDTTESFYYVLNEKDLAKGLGRFDSAKAGCISYFNQPGTCRMIMDKAYFQWNKEGFSAVLVSALDKDSNVVFNIVTSVKPILLNEEHP